VEGDGFTVEQLGADPLPTVHLMSLVDLDVAADGRVWAWTGHTLLTWGGDTWRRAECCESGTRAVFPQDDGSALAVTLDPGGRLRAARPTIDGSIVNVVRHAVDGSSARGAGLELGPVTGDDLARRSQGLLSFASVGDGVVWAALPFGAGPEGAQLWRWEQGEWQAVDLPAVDGEIRAMDITAGRDGSVWVYLADPRSGAQGTTWSATRRLARLQGGTWTVWTAEDGIPPIIFEPGGRMAVGRDGDLWMPTLDEGGCSGLTRFDGKVTRPFLPGRCILATAVGPDGTAWAAGFSRTGDGGSALFRIEP
jgi:hypothetical protein